MTRDDSLDRPERRQGGFLEPEAQGLRSADSPTVGLVREVHAVADRVGDMRRAVVAFAQAHGASAAALADIAVAVSEACTNVVMHAYIDAPAPGLLSVEASYENDELVVIVSDDGKGMAPRPDSPGLGLGLPLIAELSQRLEVSDHTPTGTKLYMTFATTAAT